jgi:hypothetical protein
MRSSALRTRSHRAESVRRALNETPRTEGSNIDAWLQRLSHLAQIGLVILTLLALFYTVLPLYKTALLEESISRKELEYQKLVADQTLIYEQYREFLIETIPLDMEVYCLADPNKRIRRELEKTPIEDRPKRRRIDIMGPPSIILDNPAGCLRANFNDRVKMSKLTEADKMKIITAAAPIMASFEFIQLEAREQYSQASTNAKWRLAIQSPSTSRWPERCKLYLKTYETFEYCTRQFHEQIYAAKLGEELAELRQKTYWAIASR